ncbi:MAG: hypothetical protein ACYDCM_07570 [Candidatus Acidiferrales bacterium]
MANSLGSLYARRERVLNRRAIESDAELRAVWYISSPQRHG